MRIAWVGIALLILLSTACSDPKINASSEAEMKASVEKVRSSLPEAKKKEFDEALVTLTLQGLSLSDIMSDAGKANAEAKMKQALHGKTAAEVIAEADRIVQERKKKEKEQALREIRELKGKRAEAEQASQKLKSFEVVKSRFYKEKNTLDMTEPIIELEVVNKTEHPVSRAYFSGTLASPGRAVPWLQEDFSYKISGGIEPGEKAHWRLAPNMFSEWGKVKAPADAILTVEVIRLDGADGSPLYSSEIFSEYDAKRLEELMRNYPEAMQN